MKTNKIIAPFFLLITFTSLIYSQATKEQVFFELVNIYKHVRQVSFHFNLIEENFSGSLTAKKGNKYKMVIGDRLVISDGKTIWNFSPKENKVVISNFEEIKDQVSLENLFFSFLENFEPANIKESNEHSENGIYILSLHAKEKFKSFHHINSVELWVDRGTYDILRFIITNPQKMTWQISKLRLRKKAKDNLFKFIPNDDCTIIDLR
jgi:outer membrane lipoprotein-sorting protein